MKNNVVSASLAFGLSFLIKLYPVFLLPLLLKKFRFKKAVLFYSIFLLIVVVFYFPFLPQDRPLTSSIFKYLSHWEFNGSVYQFVNIFLNNGQTARLICTVCLVVAVAVISFSYKNFLYDFISVVFSKKKRILLKTWNWTKSRSSDGGLVVIGGCDEVGADVSTVKNLGRWNADLGVAFSR